MIQDNIRKMEDAIRGLEVVDSKKKAELLGLLESLKSEADQLSKAHETLAGLAESLRAFEGAHPKLVELADELCLLLSRIGI